MSRIDAWMGEAYWQALRSTLRELWVIPGGAAVLNLFALALKLLGADIPWWYYVLPVPLALGAVLVALALTIVFMTALYRHQQKGKDQ